MDINALKLTDEEIMEVRESTGDFWEDRDAFMRLSADAQLAKALWGLADTDEFILLNLEYHLEAAGIPRPEQEEVTLTLQDIETELATRQEEL